MKPPYDAVVVGSGPNGLAAAICMAQAGLATLLVEGEATVGGGMRTSPLTLPGFRHDVCSAVHPLGIGSPFFSKQELDQHGLEWVQSPTPVTHVLDDGRAVALERSLEATTEGFGEDGPAYRELMAPFVDRFDPLLRDVLGPLGVPAAPTLMARFGLVALRSMVGLARDTFRTKGPAALLAGIAAHAMVPLDQLATSSFALVLAMAGHAVGWPVARGGSQSIADALVSRLESLGGEVVLGQRVSRLEELPSARAYLLDVSPPELVKIAGRRLPAGYVRRLGRVRYAPGSYKVDWALSEPIPWRDARCRQSVTVHLSGDIHHVTSAEKEVHRGRVARHPFVLLGQPSIVDSTRAPSGKHAVWAYCHVPHGSTFDALGHIEREIERFAPGFRDTILARHTRNAAELAGYDSNFVGGDINGGLSDLGQLFFRPVVRADPYSTPAPDVFLCSTSTPPGGGVHGMCGYYAARSALRNVFGLRVGGLT